MSSPQTILEAARGLRAGELVILPTETLYGVGVSAASGRGVSLLRDLITVHSGADRVFPPSTWHAPDSAGVIAALGIKHPTHLRLFKRLAPGPVRFVVELNEPARAAAALGALPGVLENGQDRAIAVRIPEDSTASEVLSRAGVPVIMERISVLGLGDGTRLPPDAIGRAAAMGISRVIDSGPTRFAKPSTSIRLTREGGYNVTAVAAYEERYIRKKMERTLLFICTGNTCRSPMAEAIARDLLARHGVTGTRVVSAGVTAADGAPMTPEAREALVELGIDPGRHRSRAADSDLIEQAEHVYAMTRSHLRAVEAAGATDKSDLLDPEGHDVPDPIGGPMEEYRDTAQRLRTMILQRLEELGLLRSDRAVR